MKKSLICTIAVFLLTACSNTAAPTPSALPSNEPLPSSAPALTLQEAYGTWEGTTYTNTFAKLRFTADDTFTIEKGEDIDQDIPGLTNDASGVMPAEAITSFSVMQGEAGINCFLVIDQSDEAAITYVEGLAKILVEADGEEQLKNYTTAMIAGQSFQGMHTVTGDIKTDVYVTKVGDYLVSLTLIYPDAVTEDAKAFLSAFEAY